MEFGLTEIVVQALPITQPEAISLTDSSRWNALFGSGHESSSGVKVTHRSTIGYPPFWRGVNLLANGVAGLPIDVFRRDGDDRVVASTHSAQKLIKRMSSPVQRARKFRKTLQSHALLFGNGFAYIERNERFQPTALWILDPQRMIVRFVDGELWYSTTIDGEQVRFPGRDVLHITGLTHDGICGYSAVDIMAEALGVGMAAQRFGSRFFGSGANMSGLLMVPGHFPEDKIRNTLSAWNEMATGLNNSHKVALLQDGVKFQQMTVPPDSAQFLETRNFEVRAVVANILGVPPHLLGDDSRTSHNSLESEEQSFLTHSLNPWLQEWEGEYELKLLSEREQERGTHFIEYNREAAVQMLFKEKVDGLYRQVEMGILTVNEARRKMNEADIGEDGDKRYHPANWMVVGEEPEPMDAPDTPPDDTEAEPSQPTQMLRAMIESSVTNALRVEHRRVIEAASTEKNFCTWLDTFYDHWCENSVGGLIAPDAAVRKRAYASESKRQLLDVAGSSTTTTLPANITELVQSWDDRSVSLTESLIGVI